MIWIKLPYRSLCTVGPAAFSHSFRNRKPDMLNKNKSAYPPLPDKNLRPATTLSVDTASHTCLLRTNFFFIRTYHKNAFCVMQTIRTKNTINNFHKNEKTDSHLFNRSAFCSNGSIVFTQNLPGLSRLGCGKRHRRITAAKHLTPTTTNINGEASRCQKQKKDLTEQVLFFVCTRIGYSDPQPYPISNTRFSWGNVLLKKS